MTYPLTAEVKVWVRKRVYREKGGEKELGVMVVVEEHLALLGKITKQQLRFLHNQSTVFTQDPSFPPSAALASMEQLPTLGSTTRLSLRLKLR